MKANLFTRQNARFKVRVSGWKEAIQAAGALLTERGSATERYVGDMIESVEKLGPYIVIAPGVALAHARGDDAVLANDLVLVTLAEPVFFGHATNDPVDLVFAFCARTSEDHIVQLQLLAENLADDAWVGELRGRKGDQKLENGGE